MARDVGRSSITTPFGEGRTLYPFDLATDPTPELALLAAVVRRAQEDAVWLTDLEKRTPETWTPHERRRWNRMTAEGIVPPRFWLSS